MRRLVVMLVAALAVFLLAGCGGGSSTPPTTVTVTAPPSSAPSTSTAAPAEQVVIPGDLVGQNGAIAYDQLQQLGFSNVQLASRDAGSKVVLNPANWTVTKVDPKPGTKIMSNRTVVVTMTKE